LVARFILAIFTVAVMFGSVDHGARAGLLAGSVDAARSEAEGCCASGAEPATAASDEEPPCCPTGCEHCVRSCCPTGIAIVLPPPLPDPVAPAGVRGADADAADSGRWSPPSLDRPPKG